MNGATPMEETFPPLKFDSPGKFSTNFNRALKSAPNEMITKLRQ